MAHPSLFTDYQNDHELSHKFHVPHGSGCFLCAQFMAPLALLEILTTLAMSTLRHGVAVGLAGLAPAAALGSSIHV